jgi:hypothetical protein
MSDTTAGKSSGVETAKSGAGGGGSPSYAFPIALGVLVLVAVGLGVLYMSASSQNSTLTNDKRMLAAQNATLTSDKSTLTAQNAALSSEKTTLITQTTALTTQNTTLTAQNTALATANASLSTSALAVSLATTQANLDVAQVNLSNTQTSLATVSHQVALSNFISGIYLCQLSWGSFTNQTAIVTIAFAPISASSSTPMVYLTTWIPPTQLSISTTQLVPTFNVLFSGSTQGTSQLWMDQTLALGTWTNPSSTSLVFSASNAAGTVRIFSTDGTTLKLAYTFAASGSDASGGTTSTSTTFTNQTLQRIS